MHTPSYRFFDVLKHSADVMRTQRRSFAIVILMFTILSAMLAFGIGALTIQYKNAFARHAGITAHQLDLLDKNHRNVALTDAEKAELGDAMEKVAKKFIDEGVTDPDAYIAEGLRKVGLQLLPVGIGMAVVAMMCGYLWFAIVVRLSLANPPSLNANAKESLRLIPGLIGITVLIIGYSGVWLLLLTPFVHPLIAVVFTLVSVCLLITLVPRISPIAMIIYIQKRKNPLQCVRGALADTKGYWLRIVLTKCGLGIGAGVVVMCMILVSFLCMLLLSFAINLPLNAMGVTTSLAEGIAGFIVLAAIIALYGLLITFIQVCLTNLTLGIQAHPARKKE